MKLFLILFLSVPAWGLALEPLPASKLEALKKKPCMLLHVWATWCSICVEEMPALVKFIEGEKKLFPVIVDASTPFVQDSFSKKWNLLLEAKFKSYLKPGGGDEAYMNAIDPKWQGALPYSALYHKGAQKEVWVGATDFSKIRNAVKKHCN